MNYIVFFLLSFLFGCASGAILAKARDLYLRMTWNNYIAGALNHILRGFK